MNELVTIESAIASVESGRVTIDAVSILEYEIFEGIPVWFIIAVISVFLIFILLVMLIFWVFHAEEEVKREVHHAPTPHQLMIELQKELLRSMESTSKQNWLMIWLTVLFITVSVLGGAVILNFFQNIGDFGATWIAQFIEYLNSLLTQ